MVDRSASESLLPLETLLYRKVGAVGVLTLNRPARLNAMNRTMLRELHQALDVVEADDEVRALVLTGAGEAFCSGFDLKEQMDARPQGVEAWRTVLQDDFDAIIRFWWLSKPTIAAVRGHCVAGGCELALCCDVTIAAENAVFGEPELKFGAGIVVMILPWLIGAKKAKELLFSGEDTLGAVEAERLGLVNKVVPVGEELAAAIDFARRLAVVDPKLMRATKAAVNRTYDIMGLREALQSALDIDLDIEAEGSPDKAAFMDIVRSQGLKAALTWRDNRFAP
jgi:enoyl-CoA hydratase